jgi:superfamily II DNA/RNA helicase
MTATPHRLDGKDIMRDVNFNVPFKMGIKEGIKRGFLCPFHYIALWDDVDYSDIRWHGHTYRECDLDKKLLIKRRDDQILREFKDKMRKRQTIAFCVSVKHVERLVEQFNKNKIRSIGVTYKTPVETRRKIIRQFRDGQYQVLFTRDIFNEGVDFPEVEGLLFLRPTFSKTTFLQQLGRGLRIRKGKRNVKVLDFIGNYVNAYMIREWVHEIVPKQGLRKGKPVYRHNLPTVNFDARVIALFDRQEASLMTKENLINEYYIVKKKLKKVPTAHQIGKFGRFGIDAYKSRWGSWLNFKTLVGDNTIRITSEQIKKQFKKFYKKHGRPPTVRDLRKYKMYSDNTIRKVFGSYGKCMLALGWKPRKHTKLDINQEVIIRDFKQLKKKLGRVPFLAELLREVPYGFDNALEVHFKNRSYEKFLKQMGEKPTPKPKEFYIRKSERAEWLKRNK